MPLRLDAQDPEFSVKFEAILKLDRTEQLDVENVVKKVLADVQARGDDAVIEYTKRFDRVELTPTNLKISHAELTEAQGLCDSETISALRLAAERISDYHQRQKPDDLDYHDAAGIRLGHRWTAIDAAGLYVPGGTAAYPSSVLMNALPAKIAGVERLAMVVPAPGGKLNPLVLAAAAIAGVTEVYRIGGAQAVGALAYGTETIGRVDKIVGPGNAYVAAAKRQVYGTVGIDMIAGPSEILVVSDSGSDPSWIAADLLSQAEHDTAAQSILITDDKEFANRVALTVESQLQSLPRNEIARASWENYGVIITVSDLDDAVPLIDAIAPEHLELAIDNPDHIANRVKHAGAIFLGRNTPEAVGDYVAGPNHVLPTMRNARFSSGLSVFDFMKRSSFIACDPDGLKAIGPAAITLAQAEGLDAHARSIAIRLGKNV